jgi:hypothetical protein
MTGFCREKPIHDKKKLCLELQGNGVLLDRLVVANSFLLF